MDNDENHILKTGDRGWTMQHPLSCRPNLFDCEYNILMEDYDDPPTDPGFYTIIKGPNGLEFKAFDEKLSD